LARFEFKSGIVLFCFFFYLCFVLSRDVQVAGAAWRASMRIMAGVGDFVQMTGDGRTGQILDGQTIERSGGTVCSLHCERGDDERGFLD
jgi:hypothetical protein